MKKILALILIIFTFEVHAQVKLVSNETPPLVSIDSYLETLKSDALHKKYPSNEVLHSYIEKRLDEMATKSANWAAVFQLIGIHYEAGLYVTENGRDSAIEIEKFNAILSKNPNIVVPKDFFDSIRVYLRPRGSPEVSEIWWRLVLSSGSLIRDSVERARIWTDIVDAQINQGAFSQALQTTDQWLAYEKRDPKIKFYIIFQRAKIALGKDDTALLDKSVLEMNSVSNLLPEEREQLELRQVQSLFKNKKYKECQVQINAKLPSLNKMRKFQFSALLLDCLIGDEKPAEVDIQLANLLKSPENDPAAKMLKFRAQISVEIQKKKVSDAYSLCLRSLYPIPKVQQYAILMRVATCAALKPANKSFSNLMMNYFNTLTPELERLAKKSEWVRALLDFSSIRETATSQTTAAKLNSTLSIVKAKFSEDSLLVKAVLINKF